MQGQFYAASHVFLQNPSGKWATMARFSDQWLEVWVLGWSFWLSLSLGRKRKRATWSSFSSLPGT